MMLRLLFISLFSLSLSLSVLAIFTLSLTLPLTVTVETHERMSHFSSSLRQGQREDRTHPQPRLSWTDLGRITLPHIDLSVVLTVLSRLVCCLY